MEHKEKQIYTSPQLTVVEILVEKGFQASTKIFTTRDNHGRTSESGNFYQGEELNEETWFQ